MNMLNKRVLSSFILASFLHLSLAPAFATDITSGNVLNQVGGKYGADLIDVTGATVNTNGNYADITNTQKNSVLNWNTLNTAPGQTLNYNMQEGQSSFNRVLDIAPSTFAGNLTSNDGRLIIANPYGMIFENGSYTNVNSLILTTHDAIFFNIDNGNLNLNDINSTQSNGIKIGGIGASQYAAVMRIADDLNIISNGIKIDNADILVGNNARLITADGVNFVAASTNPVITKTTNTNAIAFDTKNNAGKNISSNILVKDSAIAVKDSDGKLYFIAKDGNVNSNIAAINSALDAKIALDVAKDATFEVIGVLDVSGINKGKKTSKVGGNLIAKTVNKTLTLNNKAAFPSHTDSTSTEYSGKGNINLANTAVSGDTVTVNGAGVRIFNLAANNTDVNAISTLISNSDKSAATLRSSTINGVTTSSEKFFHTTDPITKAGVLVIDNTDSRNSIVDPANKNETFMSLTASANTDINIKNLDVKNNIKLFSNKSASISGLNQNISQYGNLKIESYSGNASIEKAKTKDLTLIGSDGTNAVLSSINAQGDISVKGSDAVSKATLTDVTASGNLLAIANSNVNASSLKAKNISLTSNYTTLSINNATALENITASAQSTSTLDNVKATGIFTAKTKSGNLTISDSSAASTDFSAAGKNLTVKNGNFTTIKAAAADITVENTDINGSIDATKNININNSSINNSTIKAKTGNVILTGSDLNGSTINADNLVNSITNSEISNSILKTTNGDIKISNTDNNSFKGSNTFDSSANINLTSLKLDDAIAKASNNINISNSKLNSINATTTSKSNGYVILKNVELGNDIITGITINSIRAKLNNVKNSGKLDIKTLYGIYLTNVSDVIGANIQSTNADVTINNLSLTSGNTTVNAGTKIINANISNGGDIILNSHRNKNQITQTEGIKLGDISGNSLTVTSTFGINADDATISTTNGTSLDASTNITLKGVNIEGDLNITGAKDVIISNSNSPAEVSTPTIADLAAGKTPINDYNKSKYSDSYFENILNSYGNPYGENQRISYINGNVNISNANNIDIINTAILGNLTETSYANNANLITSYVGGDYTTDRTTINETSVFESYINQYTPYYIVVPTEPLSYGYDNDRTKFGDELDTNFQRQFNPRGFAAADDEITSRINFVKSKARRGNNNSIVLTEKFLTK